jgi:hypothetical protein
VTVGKAKAGVAVMVEVNVMVGVKVLAGVRVAPTVGVNVATGVKVKTGVCVSAGGTGVGVTTCRGKLHASMVRTETRRAKYFLLI